MNDEDVLDVLARHSPFGIAVIQRATGYGYERVASMLADLASRGLIRATGQPNQWEWVQTDTAEKPAESMPSI